MTTNTEEQMQPESSPVTNKNGVRRINNLPLFIAIGGLVLFAIIISIVAYKRGQMQDQLKLKEDQAAQKTLNSSELANSVLSQQKIGELIVPSTNEVVVRQDEKTTNQPIPQAPQNNGQAKVDPQLEHIKQLKAQQFEEAVRSKTEIIIAKDDRNSQPVPLATRSTGNSTEEKLAQVNKLIEKESQTTDPNEIYRIAESKAKSQIAGFGSSESEDNGETSNIQPVAFNNQNQEDRWSLGSVVEAPSSRYTIRAGAVLPAVMITGINSDLPGEIFGQVSQNVYDTPVGKYKLIPQGTKLYGTYSSQVIFGQEAVLVAWQRLTFPDGKVLDIGAMPGADSAGYSGFRDGVNHHYIRTFGSALLMSAIVGGVAITQQGFSNSSPNGLGTQQNATTTLSQVLGQQLGQATSQMISKNMNIAPTIEIRPGYKFNVIVTKDLVFPSPYQSFDY